MLNAFQPLRPFKYQWPAVHGLSFLGKLFKESALDLNFARTKTLDSRITFSRASAGTYFDANGVMQTAGNNVARFDHDPVTGESLGLLVEESRTNRTLNSIYTGGTVGVVGEGGVLPTGMVFTAIQDVASYTVEIHALEERHELGSVSIKAVEFTATVVSGPNGGTLDLGINPSFAVLEGEAFTASIYAHLVDSPVSIFLNIARAGETVGDSWSKGDLKRGSVTRVAPSNGNANCRLRLGDTSAGNATRVVRLKVWMPQSELGTFATSYIPTTTAQVTRAADVATMTGTNFSEWFSGTAGTFFTDHVFSAVGKNTDRAMWFSVADASGDTASIEPYYSLGSVSPSSRVQMRFNGSAASNTDGIASTYAPVPEKAKLAMSYQADGAWFAANGVEHLSFNNPWITNLGNFNAATRFGIGNQLRAGPIRHLNGRIKRITYWPTRLPNETLERLTS
jgi:hypothetical protein